MAKMSTQRVVLLMVIFAASLITYDVRMHGSLQRSLTGKYLKDSGALNVWRQTVAKVTYYWNLAAKWFAVNAPAYYEFVNKTLGPHLQLFWQKVGEMLLEVWDSLKPARDWINTNVPPYLEMVTDYYVPKVLATAHAIGVNVRQSLVDIGLWLQQNVFVGSFTIENLQRYAVEAVAHLQAKASEAYVWIWGLKANPVPS